MYSQHISKKYKALQKVIDSATNAQLTPLQQNKAIHCLHLYVETLGLKLLGTQTDNRCAIHWNLKYH